MPCIGFSLPFSPGQVSPVPIQTWMVALRPSSSGETPHTYISRVPRLRSVLVLPSPFCSPPTPSDGGQARLSPHCLLQAGLPGGFWDRGLPALTRPTAGAHRCIFKVVKAVVSQNEPAPFPGLHPTTCRAKRDVCPPGVGRQRRPARHEALLLSEERSEGRAPGDTETMARFTSVTRHRARTEAPFME